MPLIPGTVSLTNCTFDQSSTLTVGGVLHIQADAIAIDHCSFNNSNADIDGGVGILSSNSVVLFKTSFNEGSANQNIGSISFIGTGEGSSVFNNPSHEN